MCNVATTYRNGCNVAQSVTNLCQKGEKGIICINDELLNLTLSWSVTIRKTGPLSDVAPFPNGIKNWVGHTIWVMDGSKERGNATIPVVKEGNCMSALVFGILP